MMPATCAYLLWWNIATGLFSCACFARVSIINSFLNKDSVLEEVCWDVVCYLGHKVGGKHLFADVKHFFVFCSMANFVLPASDIILPKTRRCTN